MKDVSGISVNLAVVGSKSCGKSAITVRFLTKRFIGEYASESDVCIDREIDIAGRTTDVRVKDTNACDWLKGPSALIGWSTALAIVYSITDQKSFELATYILEELNVTKRLESGCILLLGNKSDLNHLRTVSYEDGKNLAMQHGAHFQETSAANDCEGVTLAFERLLFSALSNQEAKLQYNNYTEQVFPIPARKCNRVVRDYNRDINRTSSQRLRRISTGSSSADTISTISDDDRFYRNSYTDSTPTANLSVISRTPERSPCASPLPSVARRKISLPVLLEKMGFHQNSRKLSHIPKLR